MAKIFEVDFRTGSFQDRSGRSFTLVGTPSLRKSDKGICITSDRNNHLSYSTQVIPNNAFTCVFYFKYNNRKIVTNEIIPVFSTDGRGMYPSIDLVYNGAFIIFLGSGNYRYFNFNYDKNWHCVIVTIPGSAQTDILSSFVYIDGVSLTAGTTQTSTVQLARTSVNRIGGNYDYYVGTTEIEYIAIYDHIFTEAERAKAYSDFLNSYPLESVKTPDYTALKPMDLSRLKDTGLIAAYNMIPNGNTLVDISGNNITGTTYNATSIKNGLSFNPSKYAYVSLSSHITGYTFTFSIRCKINTVPTNSIARYIFFGSKTYASGFWITDAGILAYARYAGSFTDQIKSTSISFGKWVTITLTVITGGVRKIYVDGVDLSVSSTEVISIPDNTAFWLFAYNRSGVTTYSDFDVEDLRIYNRAISLQEVKDYHNSFAKRVTLQEDFRFEGADGVAKVPTGWSKSSGSFKIGEWTKSGNVIVLNSGGLGANDWTDSNSDGAADNWLRTYANGTASIVTGNGFDGRAQRYEAINSADCGMFYTNSNYFIKGRKYKLSFKYRSNYGWQIRRSGVEVLYTLSGSATGNAIPANIEFVAQADGVLWVYSSLGLAGSWFEIDEINVTEIPPLPTFKPGTKYLECVTAGMLRIPSKQNTGTWIFDLYKSDLTFITINFINNKPKGIALGNEGYAFRIINSESIILSTLSGGVMSQTVNSYIAHSTWYSAKITRSGSGEFSLYIKGGSFVTNNWTLISVAGGSGTNPVTNTTYNDPQYITLELGIGDRITNIKLTEGIEQ